MQSIMTPFPVSSTTNLYSNFAEGNLREFLFYMFFYNKRSKPIEEHLCNQSSCYFSFS